MKKLLNILAIKKLLAAKSQTKIEITAVDKHIAEAVTIRDSVYTTRA